MYVAMLIFMFANGPAFVPYGEEPTYEKCMETAENHKLRLDSQCDVEYEIVPFCTKKSLGLNFAAQ